MNNNNSCKCPSGSWHNLMHRKTKQKIHIVGWIKAYFILFPRNTSVKTLALPVCGLLQTGHWIQGVVISPGSEVDRLAHSLTHPSCACSGPPSLPRGGNVLTCWHVLCQLILWAGPPISYIYEDNPTHVTRCILVRVNCLYCAWFNQTWHQIWLAPIQWMPTMPCWSTKASNQSVFTL